MSEARLLLSSIDRLSSQVTGLVGAVAEQKSDIKHISGAIADHGAKIDGMRMENASLRGSVKTAAWILGALFTTVVSVATFLLNSKWDLVVSLLKSVTKQP